jgi:hypothetical protein
LVQDAGGEVSRGGVVVGIIQGAQLAAVLLELDLEPARDDGITCATVSVLGQHHSNLASGNQIPDPVEAGTLEGCATAPGVLYLFGNYIAHLLGVVSKDPKLVF